jgi:replicative DNA helicase
LYFCIVRQNLGGRLIMAADGAGAQELRVQPHNIEAEQALLGALLVNNDVYDRVASLIEPRHFYDPLHGRIFEVAARRIQQNALATPVTLRPFFETDAAMASVGGPGYLARLAGAAISVYNARDYAQTIHDLALRRELILLGEEIAAKAAAIELDNEPREQIVSAEQALYSIAEKGRYEGGFVTFLRAARDAVEVANAAYQRDGGLAGVSTGLMDMDRKLGGLHPSDLIILAGRPSMGKTALATNIAFNIAKKFRQGTRPDGGEGTVDGGVVGFFSLEMSSEQLATRVLSEQAQEPSERIRRGEMEEDEFRRFIHAAADLERIPLYIDDTPALPIATLAARARRLKRQHGLDVLVVDYLQLLRAGSGRTDGRVQEVSEITQGLKAMAKELDIPVIALSQLSRQVENREDKRPQLADLRESGSIEQDADIVMFVYREEYYHERLKPAEEDPKFPEWLEKAERIHNKAEVVIGKQRHGPIGTVELMFDGRFTRFSDLAREDRRDGREF